MEVQVCPQKMPSRRRSAPNRRTPSLDLTRSEHHFTCTDMSYALCPVGPSSTSSNASSYQTMLLNRSSSGCSVPRSAVFQSLCFFFLRSLAHHRLVSSWLLWLWLPWRPCCCFGFIAESVLAFITVFPVSSVSKASAASTNSFSIGFSEILCS